MPTLAKYKNDLGISCGKFAESGSSNLSRWEEHIKPSLLGWNIVLKHSDNHSNFALFEYAWQQPSNKLACFFFVWKSKNTYEVIQRILFIK